MTKKHFEAAAHQVKYTHGVKSEAERARLAAQFADFFKGTNPRFDRDRFLSACFPK